MAQQVNTHIIPADEIDDTMRHIQELQAAIKNGNLAEVKDFTERYINERLCYGNQNVCALEHALNCKKFEIFSFLRANFYITDKKEELDRKIKRLCASDKRMIRDANLKYIQKFPNAFIGFLLAKFNFDALSPVSSSDVKEMLEHLSEIEELREVFKTASEAELKIIFDFVHEDVSKMNPCANEGTMGLIYPSKGEVYVGKDLSRAQRYGTFTHELTHAVFNLIFENNCLPYCEGDVVREEEWKRVLAVEKLNFMGRTEDETEPIIRWLFKHYDDDVQPAELAVRSNHILARYFDNHEKVEELKSVHRELFNYYENFILPDLQIKNVYRVIKLNNEFGVLDRIQESKLQLKPLSFPEVFNTENQKILLSSNVPKLALTKILNEFKRSSQNKIDIKAKNIFVDVEQVLEKATKAEFLNLIETSEIQHIVFDLCEAKNMKEIKNFLKDLNTDCKIFVLCNEKRSQKLRELENFEEISITFNLDDLTDESKDKILKKPVKFQGKKLKALNFVDSICSKAFAMLCNSGEILVNSHKVEMIENFITRNIENKKGEQISLHELIRNDHDQAIVISDIAGSGKTTFLTFIFATLREEFPENWVSFVGLKDHIEELSKDTDENFIERMVKILKLNAFEAQIFKEKFSKGEVRILFDAFDEISPKCKEKTLKLFKKFLKACMCFDQSLNNQILVTTRTHLEHDIEIQLKVESYKIKPLSEEDQIKFLCDFWTRSSEDKNLINLCAIQTTQKISQMIKNHKNLIGIPIILKSIAKLFEGKVNKSFGTEIKSLKLCQIYRKIIADSLNILCSRFSENLAENASKYSSILQAQEFFTLKHFFGEKFTSSLGKLYYQKEWPLEEIVRCGILNFDADLKVYFNHETFAEFLLAEYIENLILNSSNFSASHVEVFQKIAIEEKFSVSKLFLLEMFESLEVKHLKFLSAEENETNFKFCAIFFKFSFNAQNFTDFEDEMIKFSMKYSRNSEKFESFFTEVQTFYGIEFIENFLFKSHLNLTVFEHLADNLRNKIFENLILSQNSKSETILHLTVSNFERLQKILNLIKIRVQNEKQKELIQFKNENGLNFLQLSIFHGENSFKLSFEFVENVLSKEEMRRFINVKNNNGNRILHLAAEFGKSKEIFELLWLKISKFVKNPKKVFMQEGSENQNVLQKSCLNENNPEIFVFAFEIAQKLSSSIFISKSLFLKKVILEQHFFTLGSKSSLQFLFEKISEIFDENEIKIFLKTEKGERRRNLLSLNAENKHFDSIKFLWEIFEKNLSRKEILELLHEKDKERNNFLHLAAEIAKSKDIFEFLWLKVEKLFDNDGRLKNYLKIKGRRRRNILQVSIVERNEILFFYIFENIFCKIFGFKDFIYECDDDFGENFLHDLARYGSVSMLKFSFKKLQEKLEIEEIKKLLKFKNRWGRNILQVSIASRNINEFNYIFENLFCNFFNIEDYIYECDENGENFLQHLASFGSASMLEILFKNFEENLEIVEFKKFMKIRRDEYPTNLFHCAAFKTEDEESKTNLLKMIGKFLGKNDTKEMLFEELKSGFDFFFKSNNLESIKLLWKYFEKFLRRQEILKIINKKDKNGNTFLLCGIYFIKSTEIFEFLWLKVETFFDDKEKLENYLMFKGHEGRNILQAAICMSSENLFFYIFENIFCKFFDLTYFIYKVNDFGENFFHLLARFGKLSMLETSFKSFEEKFELEEINRIMKIRTEIYERNILHCAASNPHKESIIFLIEKIKKILNTTEIEKMLNEADKDDWGRDDYFPLHYVVEYNTAEVFELFVKLYEEELPNDIIMKLLDHKNILSLAPSEENKIVAKKYLEKKYKLE